MRTESNKYSTEFIEKAVKYIKCNYSNICSSNNKYISDDLEQLENKDSSNPHEAIRVSNLEMKEYVMINKEKGDK